MALHTYGTMGVDWEERVRFDRLREERLARIKAELAALRRRGAAVLRHDQHPLHHGDPHRHVGAGQAQPLLPAPAGRRPDHVGLRLGRPAPRALLPVARRGPLARRHLDAARRDVARRPAAPRASRARSASSSRSAACSASRRRRRDRARRAVRAAGRGHPDRRRPAADAAGARDQDAGRDHAAQHGLHDGRRRLRGALPGDAPRHARERVRRARQQGALRAWARSSSRASTRSPASAAPRTRTSSPTARCAPATPPTSTSCTRFNGYRTCYYRTFAVASASPALVDAYKRCRYYLDAAIDRIRPGVTTGEVVEVWPKAQGVRLPGRGGRVRAAVRPRRRPLDLGEAGLQPARLARPPRGDQGGHGLRARDVLARDRRLVGGAHRGAARRDQGRLRGDHALPGRGPRDRRQAVLHRRRHAAARARGDVRPQHALDAETRRRRPPPTAPSGSDWCPRA